MVVSNNYKKEVINEISRSEQLVQTTLQIAKVRDDLYCHLLDSLVSQLENMLKDKSKEFDYLKKWKFESYSYGREWIDSYLKEFSFEYNNKFGISIVSTSPKKTFRNWKIGVYLHKDHKDDKELSKIKNHYNMMKAKNNRWGECKRLDDDYANWDKNNSAWIDITNGKLANYIFQEFEAIVKELEENHLLPNS